MKRGKGFLAIFLLVTILFSSVACSKPPETKSGTATAQGFGGPVTVTVTVTDGVLADVVVEAPAETAGIGTIAVENFLRKCWKPKALMWTPSAAPPLPPRPYWRQRRKPTPMPWRPAVAQIKMAPEPIPMKCGPSPQYQDGGLGHRQRR